MIQVQVRVKLGDQMVALVQLGNFPREPEDFTEGGGNRDLRECQAGREAASLAASSVGVGGGGMTAGRVPGVPRPAHRQRGA